ncbi:MAG: tetratricopeptide repeat protein [Ekhidna sp.]
MRFAAIAFLFICFSLNTMAQSDAEALLLERYNAEKFDQVLQLADSILNINPEANRARIHHIKADAYYFLNDVPSSLESYLKAIELNESDPLSILHKLECYSHAGFCYKYLGQYVEALPYYHTALTIANSISDSIEIANQSSNLGTLYSQMGNYNKALNYFNTAYQIDFALKDKTALAYDLVNLGGLKLTTGENKKAIEYFKEGLKVKETIAGDHTTHILRLGKLSQAFLADGQLDSAQVYNDLSMKGAIEIGDSLSLNKQLITNAAILNSKENYGKALKSAQEASAYFNGEENSYQVGAALQLAIAYMGQRNYNLAYRILSDALDIALSNNLLEQAADIYKRKGELNEELSRTKTALLDYKNFQTITDSIKQMDKQNAILILDQEYQTSKKQQEIELLKTQEQVTQLELSQKQRDNIILWVLLVVITVIACFAYYFIRKKNQLQNSLLTSQINELRLQIKSVVEGSSEGMNLEMQALNESIEEPLSEREFEILNYAISDLSNVEIADKTFVSVNTVKYHLKNVYAKLGVSNRKEALKIAFQSISK